MSGRGSGGRAPRTSAVSRDEKNGSRKPYDRRPASSRYKNDNRNGSNRDRQLVPDFDTDGTEYIKIASESNTKKVAGKIAHEVREGNKAPTILAIGAASLNAAVKAIAVARQYISDDRLDLTCQPAFREGMSETCLALYLHKRHGNTYDDIVRDAEELNVKGTTAIPGLAGAISGRIREGKQIYLVAQGADAVTCAIAAICKSRTYLEEDGLDLHCAPKFVHIERNGSRMTALRFDIKSENAS